ncbi:MAG: ZrgA family zinc uptake protein [Pontibacterium sp.]
MKLAGFKRTRLSVAVLGMSMAGLAIAAGHGHEHEHNHGHDHHEEHHHEMESHAAHTHGESSLTVVLQDEHLEVELHGPAANFVGFEYQAKSADEKAAVHEMEEILEAGIVALPKAAECELEKVSLKHGLDDAHHEHEDKHHDEHKDHDHHAHDHDSHDSHDDHEAHGEDRHSEVEAGYSYHCHNPSAIKAVEFTLFTLFPLTKAVDFQAIVNDRQFGGELTAKADHIDL